MARAGRDHALDRALLDGSRRRFGGTGLGRSGDGFLPNWSRRRFGGWLGLAGESCGLALPIRPDHRAQHAAREEHHAGDQGDAQQAPGADRPLPKAGAQPPAKARQVFLGRSLRASEERGEMVGILVRG